MLASATANHSIQSAMEPVLAAALANKLARIAWSVLYHGRSFARDFEPQSVS